MSFPAYQRYKDSGVGWLGEVPEHWEVARLRFVAEINPSKTEITGLDRDTEVSFVPMEAVGEDGSLALEHTRLIGEVESGYTYFREGDVTVAKITPCFENGKGAVMRGLQNQIGFGTTELIVVRPHTRRTTSDFLHALFCSTPFRSLGEATMYGAGGQKRVPNDFVENFPVALPPVEEQRTINAFLDHETAKIDALVEEQRRLIELLKEKRQAVISHAVTKGLNPKAPMKDTGIEWLGEVPEHWTCLQVGKVCKKIADGPHFSPNYVDDGVLFLSARNIKIDGWALEDVKYISETDCKEFDRRVIPQVGDVLYTKGGTTGIARVVDLDNRFQVWVHIAVLKLEPSIVDPYFLAFALNSIGCYEQSQLLTRGATNNDLGLTRLVKIWFVLPSLKEQKLIVSYLKEEVARLDALIAEARRVTTLLQERRTALISAAVTGKIDVRGLVRQPAELELA